MGWFAGPLFQRPLFLLALFGSRRPAVFLHSAMHTSRKEAFQLVGKIIHGVGSAEGLAREIEESKHVLLCYDEMKAMMDKSVIKGSVLLPMITSMFEGTHYSSAVKNKKQSIDVKDGHLSILGCCTTTTYGRMWDTQAISIGLNVVLNVLTMLVELEP